MVSAMHADPSNEDGLPEAPPVFWAETFLSHAEEAANQIPNEVTDKYRDEYSVPGSDDIEEIQNDLKRDRGNSGGDAHRPKKAVRRSLAGAREQAWDLEGRYPELK